MDQISVLTYHVHPVVKGQLWKEANDCLNLFSYAVSILRSSLVDFVLPRVVAMVLIDFDNAFRCKTQPDVVLFDFVDHLD